MKQYGLFGAIVVAAIAVFVNPARADFEVTGPDGRRILLQDDKTWRYVDPKAKADKLTTGSEAKGKDEKKDGATVADKPKDSGEAVLHLEGKIDGNRICRFQLRLVNNLPYEIRSLVPEFAVYRSADVVYDSVFQGFSFLKPGDMQRREIRFDGLACAEILRVQVTGGDRCEMGDLDKFANERGKCLARVRVVASDVVRFDK